MEGTQSSSGVAEAPSSGLDTRREDTSDGEPIDWSKHTYGGYGTLHDGVRLLHDPWGRAGPATFATMRRRAEEQCAWVACPARPREELLPQLGVDPQAAAFATIMCLGGARRDVRVRTSFLDASYSFSCIGSGEPDEGNLVEITALKSATRMAMKHGDMACMNRGECVIALAAGASRATLVRWPDLSRLATARFFGESSATAIGQRTCAACGQVWHQTMRRCAACNEVAYCSPICQRHNWSRHKAACKIARARSQLKYDPTVIGE